MLQTLLLDLHTCARIRVQRHQVTARMELGKSADHLRQLSRSVLRGEQLVGTETLGGEYGLTR